MPNATENHSLGINVGLYLKFADKSEPKSQVPPVLRKVASNPGNGLTVSARLFPSWYKPLEVPFE